MEILRAATAAKHRKSLAIKQLRCYEWSMVKRKEARWGLVYCTEPCKKPRVYIIAKK